MKALTIWEPWATLIAAGAKPYEFRGWAAPVSMRGRRIVIHAAIRPIKRAEITDLLYRLQQGDAWSTGLNPDIAIPLLERIYKGWVPPLGHALGTAKLGLPIKAKRLAAEGIAVGRLTAADLEDISDRTYAWPLTEFEPFIPPIAARGAQGFWDFPASLMPREHADGPML